MKTGSAHESCDSSVVMLLSFFIFQKQPRGRRLRDREGD